MIDKCEGVSKPIEPESHTLLAKVLTINPRCCIEAASNCRM